MMSDATAMDGDDVEKPLADLRSVLIPAETLEAWAIQRRIFALITLDQQPVPLLVHVRGQREVVVIEKAQVQRQHRHGMIDGAAIDLNVAGNRIFREVVFFRQPLDLLFALLLARPAMLGTNVQLRRFREQHGHQKRDCRRHHDASAMRQVHPRAPRC